MAVASALSNFARNTRPRITGTQAQPTTRPPRPGIYRPGGSRIGTKVRGPAPVASVPAAPAAPSLAGMVGGTTPLSPDATYEQQVAAAMAARDANVVGLAQQRTAGLQEYGYTEQPGGGVQFDPNNPFSRAALLRKHYQQQQAGNVTGMAARGQLYSGALQNQQDYAAQGFNQGENDLQRSLLAFLAANTGAASRAGTDYETAAGGYSAERLGRVMDNPLYDPAALSNAPAPNVSQAPVVKPRRPRRPGVPVFSGQFR